MLSNETLAQAIGRMGDDIMRCSAPCNRAAVGAVLALLAGAIVSGDEVALESVCHAWAVKQYPEVYARWAAEKGLN